MEHKETKHDDTKTRTNEAKLTNIRVTQQAQTYRMDSTTKDRTLIS